jgi:single-strand DNA-binding protein
MNHIVLIGRIGKDPEIRTTQGGKSCASFTLATDSGFGDNKKTDWHSVVCFDRSAEVVHKYLKKGSGCAVIGRLTYDTYEKDGQKRTVARIVAERVEFLPRNENNSSSQTQTTQQFSHDTFEGKPLVFSNPSPTTSAIASQFAPPMADDDIPF